MGGSSSSSSSQSSNQSSISQGLYGDQNGLNITGSDNDSTFIQTDHGAIDGALALAGQVTSDTATLLDNAGERGLSAALAVHETGLQQLSLGTEFVKELNQQSTEANLQFLSDFTRSESNETANTNLKLIGVLSLTAVAVAFALRKKGK